MKDICFRAWIRPLKRMERVVCLNMGSWRDVVVKDTRGSQKETMNVLSEDVVLMQFTGLLDRNQREIWEDDLVGWFLADGSFDQGRVEYDLERARFAIRFPDGKLWGFNADEACSRLEVVGNIHEKAK